MVGFLTLVSHIVQSYRTAAVLEKLGGVTLPYRVAILKAQSGVSPLPRPAYRARRGGQCSQDIAVIACCPRGSKPLRLRCGGECSHIVSVIACLPSGVEPLPRARIIQELAQDLYCARSKGYPQLAKMSFDEIFDAPQPNVCLFFCFLFKRKTTKKKRKADIHQKN